MTGQLIGEHWIVVGHVPDVDVLAEASGSLHVAFDDDDVVTELSHVRGVAGIAPEIANLALQLMTNSNA